MDKAQRAAVAAGGSLRESSDRREALEGAHVVYAKEWAGTADYGNEAADAFGAARPQGLVPRRVLVLAGARGLPADALPAGAA